jgi:ribonuclease T1
MVCSLRPWLLAALLWLPLAQAEQVDAASGLPLIAVAELPAEGRDTLWLIEQGGPFPYERDGVTFKNYERVLPKQPHGYYREYTVRTPGVKHRGARRIVCGRPEGKAGKGGERDEAQGARSGATETYHEGRRESEHRATQRFARAATLTAFPECYYTADHYRTFKRIKEQKRP